MVLKVEQERVKTLLADTITLLCRNGLSFKSEFCISALIGITLDKHDVFLVDIRETIKNNVAEDSAGESDSQSVEKKLSKRKRRKRRRSSEASQSASDTHTQDSRHSDFEQPTAKIKREQNHEDNEYDDDSDLVLIKSEPGLQDSNLSMLGSFNQTVGSHQTLSVDQSILSQSGEYTTPSLPWDTSGQQAAAVSYGQIDPSQPPALTQALSPSAMSAGSLPQVG